MFETKTIVTADWNSLENAFNALPHMVTLPHDAWGASIYDYVSDSERHNDSIYREYFDVMSPEDADTQLAQAVKENKEKGWRYGRLTRACLNYMASHGMLPEEALTEGSILVEVSW